MKRFLALLLCLGLMLGLLGGCAAEDTPYVPTGDALAAEDADIYATVPEDAGLQELTLAYYADRSLNPLECTDFTNRVLFSLIYQGLFSVSSDYEAVPILCSSFERSSDYKVYTIKLADAWFSDGSKVTLADVLGTYEAAQKSKYYQGRFTHISSITVEGTGIVFKLDTPMEDLPLLLDIPIVKADQVADPSPVGSGPYAMASGVTGAYLRKVPSWWCASPDLAVTADSIPLVKAESAAQIRDEFEFYDVDLVCADPCSDLYADYRCDYELWDCENGEFIFLACNVAHREIFEDDTLRSVLTYGIDRQTLVDTYYRGFARPVSLPASPSSPYYNASLANKYDFEPVKFVQVISGIILEEPLVLIVNQDDSLRVQTARAIADMLTQSGLPVTVEPLSTRVFLNRIHAGNYDMYLGSTRLSPNMDLSAFFHPYGDMSYNGIGNAALYQLCLDALDNYGNYYDLHKSVAEDGRIVPVIFCSYAVYATRGLLTNLNPSRDNVFYYTLGTTLDDALIPIDYTSVATASEPGE
ncbi:MAG: hypothetical protein IJX69_02540 [Oscillospiraceae bacterium]|nr:hypothetical protein [Oscillospiraceae bacterium]